MTTKDHATIMREALELIAGWPITSPKENMDALNMQHVAKGVLSNLSEQPQQPAGWMPIETCPLEHGKRFLIAKDCGPGTLASVSVAYRLEGSPDHWWFSDSAESVERYGYRVTHWAPLSPAPGDHPSQQEDDARDAARYRWLRGHFRFAADSECEIWFDGSLKHSPADQLDAAIDAALAAQVPQQGEA